MANGAIPRTRAELDAYVARKLQEADDAALLKSLEDWKMTASADLASIRADITDIRDHGTHDVRRLRLDLLGVSDMQSMLNLVHFYEKDPKAIPEMIEWWRRRDVQAANELIEWWRKQRWLHTLRSARVRLALSAVGVLQLGLDVYIALHR